jgi:two-component SAPR family response regulator
MNGKQLFERLQSERPKLKVVFTSGYTDDIIAPRGVLDDNVAYIPKPFTRDVLVATIRQETAKGA